MEALAHNSPVTLTAITDHDGLVAMTDKQT